MSVQLQDSVKYLRTKITKSPKIAVVLGSGLGEFATQINSAITIPTAEIPHYPISTVHGHAGKIIFGALETNGRKSDELIVFQGRVHLYESNDVQKVVYPIRVAAELGVKYLIVTNAAGGINKNFDSGTLMFISDFINLTGENPLIGTKELNETTSFLKHPPLSTSFLNKAKSIAEKNRISTKQGIYCWTKGPTYETAAEIRMMAALGADAVGMSTVPEIIIAHNYGIEILGISCITNMATGISLTKLNHEEVTETANRVKSDFTKLVNEIIFEIH